jgi:hypothetical protein
VTEVGAAGAAGPGDDWYRALDGELEQGDILLGFRVVAPLPSADASTYQYGARNTNVVVLTQSCDMQKKEQRDLLLAEVHDYDTLVRFAGFEHLKSSEYKRSLARGTAIRRLPAPS